MESLTQDIKRYLSLVYKRKGLFVAVSLTIVTVCLVVGFMLPDKYEADCTFLIEENIIKDFVKDVAVTPSLEERLKVLTYAMESRNLLIEVLDDLGFDVQGKSLAEMEGLVNRFKRNTDIESTREMDVFTVSFRDENPMLARDYINALVRKYIEMNVEEKRAEAYGASRFLSEQIKFFKDKLDNVESEVVEFRKDKGIFVAVDERKLAEEIKAAGEKLEELGILKGELVARKRMLRKQMEDEDPYAAAALGLKPEDTLEGRLLMLQDKLNTLLTKYTETHPEVERVKTEIESLKSQIREGKKKGMVDGGIDSELDLSAFTPLYQQLRAESAKAEVELAAIEAKEELLRKLIASKESYLRDIPGEKKALVDMERERKTYNNIYEELVMSLGQSEVTKQLEIQDKASTFKIIEPAILPTTPVSPNRLKVLLFALFAGLSGGIGSVFLRESMDNSVRSLEAVRSFGLPVLAMVPAIQNAEELRKRRGRDIMLYVFSGFYLLLLLGIMAVEIL